MTVKTPTRKVTGPDLDELAVLQLGREMGLEEMRHLSRVAAFSSIRRAVAHARACDSVARSLRHNGHLAHSLRYSQQAQGVRHAVRLAIHSTAP